MHGLLLREEVKGKATQTSAELVKSHRHMLFPVGIDPDDHGAAVDISRTKKASAVRGVLRSVVTEEVEPTGCAARFSI